MKKLLLFLFLLIPVIVNAEDLYLEELKVLNGNISPNFSSNNNKYTITLDKSIKEVEFNFKPLDGVTTLVRGNYNLENDSILYIDLISNNEVVTTYTFNILKEEDNETTFKEIEEKSESTNFMTKYKSIIIPAIDLILIFLNFKLLFLHKHKNT